MKFNYFLFILLFCLAFTSCVENFDMKYILVTNKSTKPIYVVIKNNDSMFDIEKYKIKERIKKGEHVGEIDVRGLFIHTELSSCSKTEYKGPNVWTRYLENTDEKVRIFIIEKDSVDKYGWIYVNENNIYNKKHVLTLNELDNINWELKYGENNCENIQLKSAYEYDPRYENKK